MNKRIGQWIAVSVMVLAAGMARAATGTWNGAAGATWDTNASNWSGVSGTPWDSVNGPANTAIFTGSPTPSVSGTVYAGGFYVGSGSGTPTTLVISNGTLNLGGGTEWVAIGGKRKGNVGTLTGGCNLIVNGGTVNFLNNGDGTVYFNPYGNAGASALNLNGGTVSTVTGFTDGSASGSSFNFNGGTLKFTAAPARPFNGTMYVNVLAGGAILDTGGFNVTIATGTKSYPLLHAGSGTDGGLTKTGVGTLTLVVANTYNGTTTINTGTLALSSSGSLDVGSSVSIAAGATFDVSAYATYTWGSGAGLTASGTTTNAILKGGSTGVNLGSRPATLNFTPTTFTGDASRPALNVSAGTLNLGTSTVTVNNNAATPLGAGDYTLITGTVSGSPALNPVIGGAGLAANTSASLLVSGGHLILHVVAAGLPSTTTTLTLTNSWTSSSIYGDALQFNVTVTGTSPSGLVTIRDGGVGGTEIGTGTLSGGSATVTLNPLNALTAGSHANIVAVYLGDSGNAPSTSTALGTQTVAKKALTIPDAAAQNKPYDGNAAATLTGTLAGVVSGDSVTLTRSGTFADANLGTNKTVTSTSTIDAPSQANYTLTQPTGLTASILAFTWTNLAGGDWGTATNWLDNLIGDGVGTVSFFSTLDLTADTTVYLELPKTAGTLIFGDTDPNTAAGWLLDNGGAPSNTLTLAGTTPTITVNALGGGKAVTIGAVVAGTAGLTKNGAGTLTLSATNTYTGGTTVSAGTLEVAAGGVINNAGPINAISGGTMNISGTVDVTNGVLAVGSSTAGTGTMNILSGAVVNVINGASTFANVYVGGKINNTGNAGVGILNISGTLNVPAGGAPGVNGDAGALWLNPYGRSGNSTINLNSGGLLNTARAIDEGSLPNGSIFNFDGGTLKSSYTGDSILHNSVYNVRNGGAVIDSAGANISLTYALKHSSIGGDNAVDGGLTKIGAGTLTLSATNTYSGVTVVSNGALRLTTASCLTTNTAVTVASGAFLNLDFAGTNTVRSLQVGDRLLTRGSVYDKNHPAVSGYIITGNGYIKVLEGTAWGTLFSIF